MSFIKQPFDEFLGFVYERVSPNEVHVTLPLQPLHINSVGIVHGGIISALVDVAMSNLMDADEAGVQNAVTIDLHTTFLQGAKGKSLTAVATIVKTGRTLMYADCQVVNEENLLVARATGTFFVRK